MDKENTSLGIPSEIEEYIEKLPKDKQKEFKKLLMVSSQRLTVSRGPLPPPEVLEQYAKILPGSPERLLQLVEKEQEHTHSVESKLVDNTIKQNKMGLFIGAFLVLMILVVALFLAQNNHDTVAGLLGTTTIIAIAVIFVLRKTPSSNSNNENIDQEGDD